MIFFNTIQLEVYTLSDDETPGAYGEPRKKYILSQTIPADLQNENNTEIRNEYGVEKDNLYKIYFDKNYNIQDTDIFKDTGGNYYQIIGEIKNYPVFFKYKKAHLIRVRPGALNL